MKFSKQDLFLNIDKTVKLIRKGHNALASYSLIRITGLLREMSGSLSKEQMILLSKMLTVMSEAFQRNDLLFVADILEYEITAVLKQ